MLRTVLWLLREAFFTAVFSNALRGMPLLRKPLLHITCTLTGLIIGIKVSNIENNYEERLMKAVEGKKYTEWYPRGLLLAERAKALGITVKLTDAEIAAGHTLDYGEAGDSDEAAAEEQEEGEEEAGDEELEEPEEEED